MRIVLLTSVLALGAAGCTQSASAAAGPTAVAGNRTIVALGDSLTAGKGLDDEEAYPAALERMLKRAGHAGADDLAVPPAARAGRGRRGDDLASPR